jgi:hypothetical protein
VNDKIGPGESVSRMLQSGCNTANKITPVPTWRTGQPVERKGNLLVEAVGVRFQNPIFARCNSNPGVKPNGRRHHETVVVVRVLADKIDAAGRTKNPHVRTEHFPKSGH